jgi:hypothetical protein
MSPALVVDKKTLGRVAPTDVAGIVERIRIQEENAHE